jgi:hypothetical protein
MPPQASAMLDVSSPQRAHQKAVAIPFTLTAGSKKGQVLNRVSGS